MMTCRRAGYSDLITWSDVRYCVGVVEGGELRGRPWLEVAQEYGQ